jgi:RNA polymerase sigma-70 factor (ECF subfamily)
MRLINTLFPPFIRESQPLAHCGKQNYFFRVTGYGIGKCWRLVNRTDFGILKTFSVMGSYSSETLKQLSDQDLITRYKESDDKIFVGELYKRYSHLVIGMCLSYFKDRDTAKDLTLAIFEKLFVELKKRDVECFRAWLTFVVRNFCISELRKQQVQALRIEEFSRETDIEESEEAAVSTDKNLANLETAINELNPFQKRCIELFYFRNMSYQQIVSVTGFSANEVKSYIQNGKRNLRLILSSK